MKYYLIAGEQSGDLHGSNLMKELAAADSSAVFRFFGGDLMESVGGEPVKHYREMAYMGFVDVVLHLKTIKQNMELCKRDIVKFGPDVLILIDYPGFNLRIAEFAKQKNIKVYWYISPKLWAWKEVRVKKIKRFVDEMFTIFPFETEFYAKHGFKVNYVGNPLMDAIEEYKKAERVSKEDFYYNNGLSSDIPLIALLAGSREKEVKRMLPVMLKATENIEGFQFVVAGVNSLDKKLYDEIIGTRQIPVVFDKTYDLLSFSHAAIVTSGTAALETALFKVPQVVVYKMEGGILVDVVFRNFVLKTEWVSLPNIILHKGAVKELIQKEFTLKNTKAELNRLLFDNDYRNKMFDNYKELAGLMGDAGCSKRAANLIIEKLKPE